MKSKGCEVTVLEARDRIGGRCYTKDKIDIGAHWIHGTEGNPITAVARELSIHTLFVGGDSSYTGGWDHLALHGPERRFLSAQEKQSNLLLADEFREELDALRRERIAQKLPDLSIKEAMAIVAEKHQLSPSDRALIDWHITLFTRDDCAAGDRELSLHWWDDGYEVYGYGDSVFLNGYGELIEALAQGIDIRLRHEVSEIRHGRGLPGEAVVRIATSHGEFAADAVLITLPLGVLKAGVVKFDPPLPEAKTAAIQRLGLGNLTKVIVHFDAPFWPPNQYVFGYSPTDISRSPATIINIWKSHQIPALVLLIGGPLSREIERWPEPELRPWAVGILRELFGDQVPEPRAVARSEWSLDPYARGSYSYIAVGSSPADIETLAEPVGEALFFAGEATHRGHWAAAHGAYASGLREAARIARDPGLLPSRTSTESRRWREMMMRASRFFGELSSSIGPDELQRRLSVLGASPVFSVIPPNEMRMFATMFEPAAFHPGEIICQAGDEAGSALLIVDGVVQVELGDGTVVAQLQRGEVVGEYGMFVGGKRTATLVAKVECKALRLDYQRFHRFLLACPEACMSLLKSTVQRLVSSNQARIPGPAGAGAEGVNSSPTS